MKISYIKFNFISKESCVYVKNVLYILLNFSLIVFLTSRNSCRSMEHYKHKNGYQKSIKYTKIQYFSAGELHYGKIWMVYFVFQNLEYSCLRENKGECTMQILCFCNILDIAIIKFSITYKENHINNLILIIVMIFI